MNVFDWQIGSIKNAGEMEIAVSEIQIQFRDRMFDSKLNRHHRLCNFQTIVALALDRFSLVQ